MPSSTTAGLIPARWASTRFPGKPLHPIAGKPLVQHVWERCRRCTRLDHLAIATDDIRIAETARAFGADVVMTSADHPTGTDRIAEAARSLDASPDIIINIQGDEPLIDPGLIDSLAAALQDDPTLPMVTAAHTISDETDLADPDVVKVVRAASGDALYFSRSPLPYYREQAGAPAALRHIGLYGFRDAFLQQFISWPPSPLELAESLEQLRALENGARIGVVLTDHRPIGVDTPAHVATVEAILQS